MLLRLISNPPFPTVLFNVTFPNLPDDIPLPPNWAAQLHRLSIDDLDIPDEYHVLDKSTWMISLLEEVTFDLSCLTVTCLFIDGITEEWPLMQYGCTELLESVLLDVHQSAVEGFREKEQVAGSPVVSSTPPAVKKHKKSRSLLMTIVATFVPSISLSSPVREFFSRPSSPVVLPPPTPTAPPAEPTISSRGLRKRARSNLVDAYRCFVATELTKRARPGGYYTWIAESTLRRLQSQMCSLVEQTGGIVPELSVDFPFVAGAALPTFHSHYPTRSSTYCEDEGDGRSIAGTTDTDGSSVHTPTESPMGHQFQYVHQGNVPHTSSPSNFSPEDMELYASLNRQCLRLRQVLYRAEVSQAHLVNEEKHISAILEIKSRRRAWSNRQYCGGAPMAYLGLATPFQSSPLANFEPVTAEDWTECSTTYSLESLSVSTADHDLSELFPTVEEHEDAAESEAEVQFVKDLEMGLLAPIKDGFARAPPMRVRRRSSKVSNWDSESIPKSSPLLCQPFRPCAQTQKNLPGVRESIYDPDFAINLDIRPVYFASEDGIPPYDQEWIRPQSGIVQLH